jgi:putative addiction module component (TIGR02574 family)
VERSLEPTLAEYLRAAPTDVESAREAVCRHARLTPAARLAALRSLLHEMDASLAGRTPARAPGNVRATQDLDLLVHAPAVQRPAVFELIRRHGFDGEDAELRTALRERDVASLRAGPVTVDVLVRVLPYHHAVLARAVRQDTPAGAALGSRVRPRHGFARLPPQERVEMSPEADKVIADAERLTADERTRVVERLLASLDGPPDPDAAAAWVEEISRRSREIDAGLVEPVPWSEVKARVERRIRDAR